VPAPPSSPEHGHGHGRGPGLGATLGASFGLLALGGATLPLDWGAAPALAGLVVALGLGGWRARTLRGMDAATIAALPRARRWIVAALVVLPAVIVVASAARAIAGLCVATPPAIAALLVLVGLAIVPARGRGTSAALGVVAAGLAIAAAIAAARFEAAGPGARGFAHGGPILGIHPFQTTAIVIDGHGPFDLPINDYVEPDGSKGYGPAALAEALQRDLEAIAAQQFSDGPARAYRAFAGARVEAVDLPATQERLDRPALAGATEPHIVVWSGTTGQGSRVEFVCPGARNDPRPRPAEAVMERMCPDKYSAEASAGLGLTGRWTGYTEGRGRARVSLAAALGWARSDDASGARVTLWEQRLWAWIVLLLIGALALRPGSAAGLARGAAALAGGGAAVLGAMVLGTCPPVQVGWLARAAAWRSPWSPGQWTPALAVTLACCAAAGSGVRRRGWQIAAAIGGGTIFLATIFFATIFLATIFLATWAVAGRLAALEWAVPAADGGLEPLARGLGEALHRGVAVDLPAAEAIAAAALVAGLLALVIAALGPALRLVRGLLRPDAADPATRGAARWIGPGLVGVVIVLAGLLVLSRKTLGGAALLTPALALALTAASGLACQMAGRGRWLRAVDHALAVGLVLWTAAAAWADRSNPMMAAALVVGVVAGLCGLTLLARPTAVRSGREST